MDSQYNDAWEVFKTEKLMVDNWHFACMPLLKNWERIYEWTDTNPSIIFESYGCEFVFEHEEDAIAFILKFS